MITVGVRGGAGERVSILKSVKFHFLLVRILDWVSFFIRFKFKEIEFSYCGSAHFYLGNLSAFLSLEKA